MKAWLAGSSHHAAVLTEDGEPALTFNIGPKSDFFIPADPLITLDIKKNNQSKELATRLKEAKTSLKPDTQKP